MTALGSSPAHNLFGGSGRIADNSTVKTDLQVQSFFFGNFPSEARLFVAQGHYRLN
jgi:hypothetical protein